MGETHTGGILMAIDMVTGLLAYETFVAEAERKIDFSKEAYAVVSSDFSNFKNINMEFGIQSGDRMLKEYADYMCISDSTCVIAGRLYSDHIVGIFDIGSSTKEDFAGSVTDKNKRFSEKIKRELDIPLFHINTGICFAEPDMHLLKAIDNANLARRLMKKRYDSLALVYSDDIIREKIIEMDILTKYKYAMENDSIKVLLQPKVDIERQKMVGAEALSRIVERDGTVIMPDVFIPILEKTENIVEYDNYIARRVYAIIKDMLEQGLEPVPISINLSKQHFYSDEYIDNIIKSFKEYDISNKYIEFEISEAVFLREHKDVIKRIEMLKSEGFCVSVDDFGTGYSSLNLIGILPIDIVKLDKGFVRNGLDNERSKGVVKGIIGTLNGINMKIICEGVETKNEEKIIHELGCNEIQGFLHGEPMDIAEFCSRLY